MSKLKQILKEATDGKLNEKVLNEIESVFEKKVQEKANLYVESALVQQDEKYAAKLKKLVEAIDDDHTKKLKKVVEAVDNDRALKLSKVIKKYEKSLNEDALDFQKTLVEQISDFIEVYIDQKIPTKAIKEAVTNTKAKNILNNLRGHLAIDSALEKQSIKEAVVDGHKQINEANTKLESVTNENQQLKRKIHQIESELILEKKTANLDQGARQYINKVLGGKSPGFIKENFDYTLKLFKKNEGDRLKVLKEQAYQSSSRVDRVVEKKEEVVNEQNSHTSQLSPYLEELGKY